MIRSTLDTKRESLSAFIDGEASEIELHRLVREFLSDESLTSSWATYQHVGSTLRTDSGAVSIEDHQQFAILERLCRTVTLREYGCHFLVHQFLCQAFRTHLDVAGRRFHGPSSSAKGSRNEAQ